MVYGGQMVEPMVYGGQMVEPVVYGRRMVKWSNMAIQEQSFYTSCDILEWPKITGIFQAANSLFKVMLPP